MRLSASFFLTALVCNLQLVVVHADVEQYKHGKSLVHPECKVVLDDVTKQEHHQNTPAKVERNTLWKEEEDGGDDCSEGDKDWHHDDDCDGEYEHGDKGKHHCKSKADDSTKTSSNDDLATSTDSITTASTTEGLDPSATSSSASTTDQTSSTTESETTTTTNTGIPTPTMACTNDIAGFQACVQEGVSPDWYWCVNGDWVYQACEPDTVCRQGTDGGVYCDFP